MGGGYVHPGGRALLPSEVVLPRRMHACGFTTWGQWARNLAASGRYRLVPARRWGYQRILGHSLGSAE